MRFAPHRSNKFSSPVRERVRCGDLPRLEHGGEGGIRTLGTLLGYGALAKRCFRPLSHLTKISGGQYASELSIANFQLPIEMIGNDQRSRSARKDFGSGSAVAGEKDVDPASDRSFCGRRLFRAFAAADVRQLSDGRLRRDRE